jgi:hypothetical protein
MLIQLNFEFKNPKKKTDFGIGFGFHGFMDFFGVLWLPVQKPIQKLNFFWFRSSEPERIFHHFYWL